MVGSSDVYDSAGNWLGQHAFLWAGGTMQDLGALGVDEFGTSFSVPNALNDAGHVVGFSMHAENGVASGNRAFLYQNGAMVDLNTLLPADSGLLLENALAINNRGQITASLALQWVSCYSLSQRPPCSPRVLALSPWLGRVAEEEPYTIAHRGDALHGW